jgi:two-component system, chemotaxis family, protein-glutamate methylesterase/glutaminase
LIVVIGASAGGVEALRVVAQTLPPRLPVAILVLLHVDPRRHSVLPDLLARQCELVVKPAVNDELIRPGTMYVAPPGVHLIVSGDRLLLTHTPPVNFCRPSVDLLFQSVAEAHGPAVVAVILSGSGIDGAAGVRAVKARGGVVIVQDPASASHHGMPDAAIATGCVDHVVPIGAISATIGEAVLASGAPP